MIVDSKLLSLRRDIDTGVFDVSNGKYILIPAAHVYMIINLET